MTNCLIYWYTDILTDILTERTVWENTVMVGKVHIFHVVRRGYCQRVHTEHHKSLQQYVYNRRTSWAFSLWTWWHQLHCWSCSATTAAQNLTVEEQVLIALRIYTCGAFYQVITDGMGFHTTTMSEVVTAVSTALASLLELFVTFPNCPAMMATLSKWSKSYFFWEACPIPLGW